MNFSQNPTVSMSACKKKNKKKKQKKKQKKKNRCTHCKTINESDNFSSTSTSESFMHKQDFN